MEFDGSTTGALLAGALLVIVGGTLMSPMTVTTKAMVSVGITAFGLAAFYLGIKHGEYRATSG